MRFCAFCFVCFILVVVVLSAQPSDAAVFGKRGVEHVLYDGCEGEGAWMPLQHGIPDPYNVDGMTEMNGELYVLSSWVPDEGGRSYSIQRWTGTEWRSLTGFALEEGQGMITTLGSYNGELYLGGDFRMETWKGGAYGIARWNSTEGLTPVGEGIMSFALPYVSTMTEYRGELVVYGSLLAQDNTVMIWDGNQWRGTGNKVENMQLGVDNLFVSDDILYTTGRLQEGSFTTATCVLTWNGSTWETLTTGLEGVIRSIAVYNGDVYAGGFGLRPAGSTAGLRHLLKWDGEKWIPVGAEANAADLDIYMLEIHDGSLYAGGVFRTGDGSGYVVRFDGSTLHDVKGFDARVSRLISIGADLYASGDFLHSCGTPTEHIAKYCAFDYCSSIAGRVYEDQVVDCRNTDEPYLRNRFVHIEPGGLTIPVNDDGSYRFPVPPGTYTLSVSNHRYWRQQCPEGGTRTVTIPGPGSSYTVADFSFVQLQHVEALKVNVAGTAVPGEPVVYTIRYENIGTRPFTGIVMLEHDPVLTYQSSVPAERSHTGHTIKWHIDSLPITATGTIRVVFTAPSGLPAGTALCAHVSSAREENQPVSAADSVAGTDKYCIVTGIVEPVVLSVAPEGTQPEGYIAPSDTVLSYTVQFRNAVGSTINTVVITDTLPVQIDLSTIRRGVASHNYRMKIGEGGIAEWTFDDIMLPPGGVGFLQYEVHLQQGLPAGTIICNRALVRFDDATPIQTNDVQNIIMNHSVSIREQHREETKAMLYPNPAHDFVTVMPGAAQSGIITVYNNIGQEVLVRRTRGGDSVELDVSALPTGVYYVSVQTAAGIVSRTVTVLR